MFDHRNPAYALLQGEGLEIGALHEPAPVPNAKVQYFDVMDKAQARLRFPEIPHQQLVEVDFLGDLDREGLEQFEAGQFDFVIANHVLEHLANPIGAIEAIFRAVQPGGRVVLSVPDKRYTFDKPRALTPPEHLWADYENGTVESDDSHYLDFLRAAGPHVFEEPPERLAAHVARVRERREHAHVWDADSFRILLDQVFDRLKIPVTPRFTSWSDTNGYECFGVWEKRD